jgi:hypothetical protein
MSVDFGFYPRHLDTNYRDFRIKTRDDFDSNVAEVISAPCVEGDWIYSPPQGVRSFGTKPDRVLPYPARIFGLPKTHTLSHLTNDSVRLGFLVWCFGLLVGMRMSDREAGFLDGTPIRPNVSNDIVWSGDSLTNALGIADDFFTANATSPGVELTIRAAIHSYLASDLPTLLDYERFVHIYTAIDACYAVCMS